MLKLHPAHTLYPCTHSAAPLDTLCSNPAHTSTSCNPDNGQFQKIHHPFRWLAHSALPHVEPGDWWAAAGSGGQDCEVLSHALVSRHRTATPVHTTPQLRLWAGPTAVPQSWGFSVHLVPFCGQQDLMALVLVRSAALKIYSTGTCVTRY